MKKLYWFLIAFALITTIVIGPVLLSQAAAPLLQVAGRLVWSG